MTIKTIIETTIVKIKMITNESTKVSSKESKIDKLNNVWNNYKGNFIWIKNNNKWF